MESFRKIEQFVSQAPVLQYYDVNQPVTIQCDASGKGPEAVLLQGNKRLLTLKQGMPQLKLKCWQLFSLVANFISTSMAEVS